MPPASVILDDEARVCKAFNAFIVDFHKNTKEGFEPTTRSAPDRRHKKGAPNQERRHVSRSPSDMPASKEQKSVSDRVDWLPRIKSVHEVTHSIGPNKIMEEAYQSLAIPPDPLFRWIHVPANNVSIYTIATRLFTRCSRCF